MQENSETMIYGIHAVEELIKKRKDQIDRIYFQQFEDGGINTYPLMKICKKEKIAYQVVPETKLSYLSRRKNHQGVVALCPVKSYEDLEFFKYNLSNRSDPLLFLPAGCEDPGNLGAIIRSAVAFDVYAMLLERKKSAPLNATVSKTSVGAIEHMMFVKPSNLEREIEYLKSQKFSIIGLEGGEHPSPAECDLTGPTVLISGAEHCGIPPYLRKLCTSFSTIPINSSVDSLNVSVAAGIVLAEAKRQRLLS